MHGGDLGARTRSWLDPLARMGASFRTVFIDAAFVHRQGLTPTFGERVLKYPAIAMERFGRRWRRVYQDVVFSRYRRQHEIHYGFGGRGYQAIPVSSRAERIERYRTQSPRLAYFADSFPDLLRYKDGDTFADLGCGTGQNIRWLIERFPTSPVIGTDLSSDAVGLVLECEASPNLSLNVGDIRDPEFVRATLNPGVDHVVLSHVFSLIFGTTAEETRVLRQQIVNALVESVRKSIIIVDSRESNGPDLAIAIEQKTRAVVTDDVLAYFAPHSSGRAVLAQSGRSQAIMFFT